jgi:hypothetical protein
MKQLLLKLLEIATWIFIQDNQVRRNSSGTKIGVTEHQLSR